MPASYRNIKAKAQYETNGLHDVLKFLQALQSNSIEKICGIRTLGAREATLERPVKTLVRNVPVTLVAESKPAEGARIKRLGVAPRCS